jgi:hypothetical protein
MQIKSIDTEAVNLLNMTLQTVPFRKKSAFRNSVSISKNYFKLVLKFLEVRFKKFKFIHLITKIIHFKINRRLEQNLLMIRLRS